MRFWTAISALCAFVALSSSGYQTAGAAAIKPAFDKATIATNLIVRIGQEKRKLTGAEIKELLSGKVMKGDLPRFGAFETNFTGDNIFTIVNMSGFSTGGTWLVKNNQYCRTNDTGRVRTKCFDIFEIGENMYEAVKDGELEATFGVFE